MHIREAEVAALETEGELFVIESEQVENGGVDVVDVRGVFNGIETKLRSIQSEQQAVVFRGACDFSSANVRQAARLSGGAAFTSSNRLPACRTSRLHHRTDLHSAIVFERCKHNQNANHRHQRCHKKHGQVTESIYDHSGDEGE